jgi:hypothetical protein
MGIGGRYMRGVKIIIDGKIVQNVRFFIYVGCSASVHKVNTNLRENIQKYSKLNGVFKYTFKKT